VHGAVQPTPVGSDSRCVAAVGCVEHGGWGAPALCAGVAA
jgi:hypothetical protein